MISKTNHPLQILPRVFILALVLLLTLGGAACKSKKKAMEASDTAADKAKMEQEAKNREEEQKRREAEAAAERERAAALERDREQATYNKLGQYFASIANAGSLQAANSSISEAMTMFSSDNTPVLIVISEENGQKDYDRPTTIRQYLNYLKDTKKNPDKVSNLKVDASGKITEVELTKK